LGTRKSEKKTGKKTELGVEYKISPERSKKKEGRGESNSAGNLFDEHGPGEKVKFEEKKKPKTVSKGNSARENQDLGRNNRNRKKNSNRRSKKLDKGITGRGGTGGTN